MKSSIIHCDNDFGMFTLQKQGILELPNVIKDTISKTETIIVNDYQNTKTITEEKEINILLTVINNSYLLYIYTNFYFIIRIYYF